MPKIASFFMKKESEIFLLDEDGRVLLNDFKIWETLIPFEHTKMKGYIPRLKLVMTGGWKENEAPTQVDLVRN